MRHELWPLVSGLLVFVGLLVSSGLLLVVGSLVALVWLAARIWERYGFRKVSYSRELGRRRAFIGDTIDYTVALNNDKPLPLIWVESQDPFPEGLELAGAVVRGATLETNRHHSITTSLMPYQRATWKFSMRCTRRGYHRIGPVRMRSGDIFGFASTESRHTGVDNILVYPRVLDIEELFTPPQNPLGLARGRMPLYHDTNRVKGQRDYRSDDPLKHIDWKATARAGRLQTRVFEPSVSLNMLVALNGSTSDFVWQGTNRRLFERAVTAAASAASLADRLGYSYGLISNAVASYSGKWLSVPPGASPSQLDHDVGSVGHGGSIRGFDVARSFPGGAQPVASRGDGAAGNRGNHSVTTRPVGRHWSQWLSGSSAVRGRRGPAGAYRRGSGNEYEPPAGLSPGVRCGLRRPTGFFD